MAPPESAVYLMAVIALAASGATLSGRIDEVIGGLLSVLWWALLAYALTGYTVSLGNGQQSVESAPAFAVGAAIMALVMLVVAVFGTVWLLNPGNDSRGMTGRQRR